MLYRLYSVYTITTTSKKEFLSWQTSDLYYGFKNLSADFTSAHPGYTIYPVCLNGGAIGTSLARSSMPHQAN